MIGKLLLLSFKAATLPTRLTLKVTKAAIEYNPLLPKLPVFTANNEQMEQTVREFTRQIDISLGGNVTDMTPFEREQALFKEAAQAEHHLSSATISLLKMLRLMTAPSKSVIEHDRKRIA